MESGWNVWVWLVAVVSRMYIYIDFIILFIPTPLVSICSFLQQHPYFLFLFKMFFSILQIPSIQVHVYIKHIKTIYKNLTESRDEAAKKHRHKTSRILHHEVKSIITTQ